MPPQSNTQQRKLALQQWYRKEIKSFIPPMLEKWQPVELLTIKEWGDKKNEDKMGVLQYQ